MSAHEWGHFTPDPDAVCPICHEGDTHARPIQGDGMHHVCGEVHEARSKVKDCEKELAGLLSELEDLTGRMEREIARREAERVRELRADYDWETRLDRKGAA